MKNVLLASADQVAIDAVAAKLMGIDPLTTSSSSASRTSWAWAAATRARSRSSATWMRRSENWHFVGPFKKMTFASRMQHKIYWGPLKKPIEWSLKTVLAPWGYLAWVAYHDSFWYPLIGAKRVKAALASDWGRLFRNWETLTPDEHGFPSVGDEVMELQRTGFSAFLRSFGVLGTAVKEAPEFAASKRRRRRRVSAYPNYSIRDNCSGRSETGPSG